MSNLAKVETAVVLTGDYAADLAVGATIREAAESLQWVLGDWVLEMQAKHEETVVSLAKDMSAATDVPANTLRRYADVARAFPPAKRYAGASWSHHLAAAGSSAPDETLSAAVEQSLSTRDTSRLAQGLPLGGEVTASKESSAPSAGTNLEESALADIETARLHLQRALDTFGKPGFRLTVAVGQDTLGKLEAVSKPFIAIEAAVQAEVGALL